MFSTCCTYSATTCCICDTMLEKCTNAVQHAVTPALTEGTLPEGKRVEVWVGSATAAPHVSASKRLA